MATHWIASCLKKVSESNDEKKKGCLTEISKTCCCRRWTQYLEYIACFLQEIEIIDYNLRIIII